METPRDFFKHQLYKGVVVMKPMSPPYWRWEMEREEFWACGKLRKTEEEAKVDLKDFLDKFIHF